MFVRFEVKGRPVGKGRPRFSNAGGYVRTYTPDKTVEFENLVRLSYAQQEENAKLEGKIVARIDAYFPIPKSLSKKKRMALIDEPYDKKPDCDNIAKSVLDALNGIAYDDDSQIVSILVNKWYSEEPKTVVIMCTK